jgi:hypothetical protein
LLYLFQNYILGILVFWNFSIWDNGVWDHAFLTYGSNPGSVSHLVTSLFSVTPALRSGSLSLLPTLPS